MAVVEGEGLLVVVEGDFVDVVGGGGEVDAGGEAIGFVAVGARKADEVCLGGCEDVGGVGVEEVGGCEVEGGSCYGLGAFAGVCDIRGDVAVLDGVAVTAASLACVGGILAVPSLVVQRAERRQYSGGEVLRGLIDLPILALVDVVFVHCVGIVELARLRRTICRWMAKVISTLRTENNISSHS